MNEFSGYNQIRLAEEDQDKTSFTTPWGTYCYVVMPFGLKNAGATYQRVMMAIFYDMIHIDMEVYMDDILIKSRTCSEQPPSFGKDSPTIPRAQSQDESQEVCVWRFLGQASRIYC